MELPYLEGLAFAKAVFRANAASDHEHCEICWAKIAELPDTIHEAYSTENGSHWVCPECFAKYRDQYRWTLTGSNL